MKKFSFIWIFLLYIGALDAQVTVSGKVTQISDGAPVANWVVQAFAEDSLLASYGEASTDQNGNYSISLSGNDNVPLKVFTFKACNNPNTGDYEVRLVQAVNGVATADFQICNFDQPDCFAYFSYYMISGLDVQFFSDYYSFTDSLAPVSYQWDFGDGKFSTEENPVHTYAASGVYNVSLTVVGAGGCVATLTSQAFITAVPTCWAYIDIDLGQDSLQFVFSAPYADIDSSNNAISYAWDFGDGSTSTEAQPTHTFAQEGFYVVSVLVSGENGCTATAQFPFSTDYQPAPDCYAYLKSWQQDSTTFQFFAYGYNVHFPYNDSTAILSYHWEFGDSTSSDVANPIHQYAAQGIYNVCLTIVSADSCVAETCSVVFAYNCPIDTFYYGCQAMFGAFPYYGNDSIFVIDPTLGYDPLTFVFYDYSFGGVTSWNWDFGDGSTSQEQNPVHTYAQEGTYTVTLHIETIDGCESTASYLVYAGTNAPWDPEWGCQALFIPLPDSLGGNGFQFFDLSFAPNPITYWAWDFGDGTSSNEQNPFHVYNQEGTYTVTLKIASDSCTSIISLELDTKAPWNFNNKPVALGLGAQVTATNTPQAFLSDLKLFPNPVAQQMQLAFKAEEAADYTLRIYNATGQLVQNQQYTLQAGPNVLRCETGKLAPGMYMATLRTANKEQSVRFVKQ